VKALAIIAVLAMATTAYAQEADTVTYKVKQGDSLELIAAEFYGDHAHTMIFIMVENKLQHPRKLAPGERLKIPVNREITTAKDDSFKKLATEYLGDPNRAQFLAEFNRMTAADSLATGTTIVIPFHVTHTAAGTETLQQISLAYFGDAREADMLKTYNNLDKTALDKNETITIPIFHVRTRADKMPTIDAESAQRRDQQSKAGAEAQLALPIARTAWLQGDFYAVKQALVPLAKKLDFFDVPTATEVGLLLGKAYVAYDDTPSAVALFTQVIGRQPNRTLSPYAESPKVLEAWRQASGRVQ
jgi:LysM repeat protein